MSGHKRLRPLLTFIYLKCGWNTDCTRITCEVIIHLSHNELFTRTYEAELAVERTESFGIFAFPRFILTNFNESFKDITSLTIGADPRAAYDRFMKLVEPLAKKYARKILYRHGFTPAEVGQIVCKLLPTENTPLHH